MAEKGGNMLNQVVLVGRLTKDPEIVDKENGKKVSNVVVAVPRPYKNADGIYETDFLKCVLWDGIAQNTKEYCHTGDIIGIKGRLQGSLITKDDQTKYDQTEIIAEKVTFLSSKKDDHEKSS